jgi:hypothetical protein
VTAVAKAMNLSMLLLKSRPAWVNLIFGGKDEASEKRAARIAEFKERIRKVIARAHFPKLPIRSCPRRSYRKKENTS